MEKKKQRKPWNKGLKGEEYKKHYPNGFKFKPFPKGHKINLGKRLTKNHKNNIKNSMKGKNKGKLNNMWKGGRMKSSTGYILVLKPNHPFCDSRGYVLEHRLVMEKHIGRYLKKSEIIHHIDGNRENNLLSNLCLFPNKSSHTSFHRKQVIGAREMIKLRSDDKQ